ncbi:shikimate dehydrogenase [Candidatus Ishikawella capsulata]|uniref:Shikimate dehydrogenase (NADP(+)) n=1 Tax=Candidatus Ishikawaella capsulata Mpkobe TaxID=476281 RepID=C5WCT4_9ENTR|nr:shikimate dehydrogenase [Candidatus Ishikawaella capsulata]BAH83140.1 dehydroshikimate reductase [Candidatus Ishikawaella capsulata Mpkobe]
MKIFAVFGNPVHHSKSPLIHSCFSKQTGIFHPYERVSVPIYGFKKAVNNFFMQGGKGLNITVPFKEEAWHLAHELTERAYLAGAVNTFKLINNEHILGDNTDGIGLLSDLKRLKMIDKNYRILLLGAGGAARGVILPLLSTGAILTITNRTISRAETLANIFKIKGKIDICDFDQLAKRHFDLVINATSSGICGESPLLPDTTIKSNTRCYDMFYKSTLTPFLEWSNKRGAYMLADGLGMLVNQAAHSFYLWHGIMPSVEPVIKYFQNRYLSSKKNSAEKLSFS